MKFTMYLQKRREGKSISFLGCRVGKLESLSFFNIPCIENFYKILIDGGKLGYTPIESMARYINTSKIKISKDLIEDLKTFFFKNVSTLSCLLRLIPNEVETFEDLLYFHEYTQGMLLGVVLKNRVLFEGSPKSSEEIKREFYRIVESELSPYFEVAHKVSNKKPMRLSVALYNYMTNSCLRDPLNICSLNGDYSCLRNSYDIEKVLSFEKMLSGIFSDVSLDKLEYLDQTNSLGQSQLYDEIKSKLCIEYKYSKNVTKRFKNFKLTFIWSDKSEETSNYRLKSYLDIKGSDYIKYLHNLDIPEFLSLNLYELDFLLKMWVLRFYTGKIKISKEEGIINNINKIAVDILEENPSLFEKLENSDLLYDFTCFIYYRFLLIFNSFEYYYFKRTFFEYTAYNCLNNHASKELQNYVYGNLVCLFTNEKLGVYSRYKKTRRFFNCISLSKKINYNSKYEINLLPSYFYGSFGVMDKAIIGCYLKNNPSISLNELCEAFPWYHKNDLILNLNPDVEFHTPEFTNTWVHFASKSFKSEVKSYAKKLSVNTKVKDIKLDLKDEGESVKCKETLSRLIGEMSSIVFKSEKKDAKLVVRALKAIETDFDMYEDILFSPKDSAEEVQKKLEKNGYSRTLEEITQRMLDFKFKLALENRDDEKWKQVISDTIKSDETIGLRDSIKQHFPDRSDKAIDFMPSDKGRVIDGRYTPLYDVVIKELKTIINRLNLEIVELNDKIAELKGETPEGFYSCENSVHSQLKEELEPVVKEELKEELKEGYMTVDEHVLSLSIAEDKNNERIALLEKQHRLDILRANLDLVQNIASEVEYMIPPEQKSAFYAILTQYANKA